MMSGTDPSQLSVTLREVAGWVGGTLQGADDVRICGMAPVSRATPADLTWVFRNKYVQQLSQSRAGAVLIARNLDACGKPAIVCDQPELAMIKILDRLHPGYPHPPRGVHASAVVEDGVLMDDSVAIGPHAVIQQGVTLGKNCIVHAGVFIGANCRLGDECIFWPNVVIRERTIIGNRVVIHPNATIGADGFGYHLVNEKLHKIPHIGNVRIDDDVEIGANACIDRAKCGETFIGAGVKIDNLAQIAHNVHIGPHCCIVAQVGIAGSTELGHHTTLAGKVGVRDNVRIGSGVQVAAYSGVAGDIKDEQAVVGTPAIDKHDYFRQFAAIQRLPKLIQDVRKLQKRIEQLESTDHSKTD